ncbi:hypothetical protein [Streptomyces sp. NPDC017991]|uniref:hypothetical protein n=1 Tax=Streptomyces sp. NPDC017991 TaxID=3365026 RepID=UPI0037A2DE15
MTTAPAVLIKNTAELAQGHIVHTLGGLRVRLDEGTSRALTGRTVYYWTATVLNRAEVLERGVIPEAFMRTQKWVPGSGWKTDREDVWTVQGNNFDEWLVEDPS